METKEQLIRRIIRMHPNATEEEVGALFVAATQNDPDAIESVGQGTAKDMFAFDRERAEAVMRAMAEDDPDALQMLKALLKDMRRPRRPRHIRPPRAKLGPRPPHIYARAESTIRRNPGLSRKILRTRSETSSARNRPAAGHLLEIDAALGAFLRVRSKDLSHVRAPATFAIHDPSGKPPIQLPWHRADER